MRRYLRNALRIMKAAPPECAMPVQGQPVPGVSGRAQINWGPMVSKGHKKELNAAHRKLMRKYPQVQIDELSHVSSLDSWIMDSQAKIGWSKESNIRVNDRLFKDATALDAKLKMEFKQKMLAGNSVGDMYTHEFGHQLQATLSQEQLRVTVDAYKKAYNTFVTSIETMAQRDVSGYACTNFQEFFAESFVKYRRGEASKETLAMFKELGL